MTIDYIILIMMLVAMACTAFDLVEIYLRDLMMLQQNSYRNERYYRWFSTSNESTSVWRLVMMALLFMALVPSIPVEIKAIVVAVVTLWQGFYLLTRKYKKPLAMTRRVWRLFATMLGISGVLVGASFFLSVNAAFDTLICLATFSPFILLGSNVLMRPVESAINRRYYREAEGILRSMPALKVVGVTGSYGKTSTKHYLHRILSEHFSVTMTPGSFNTTLGVIRTVREHLRPYDEVFICEMGAKQPGDIREICDLVRPSVGIVTAVGEQHLETFKSIANVQRTKFELIDALPADGLAVVNDDFEFVANRPIVATRSVRYGVKNLKNASLVATDIRYTPRGTDFAVKGEGLAQPLQLHTALVGECNVSNLLAAVAVALELGVPVKKIQYAVSQIEQVEHRLSIKRIPGGLTIIDDAFNSNPHGSRMAVEVLGMMKDEGQRIIITPGMIELGERQHDANVEFGRNIARNADIAIIVGHYNRDAILQGLEEGGFPDGSTFPVDSFADAQTKLQQISRPGDVVLYENDLPDTFK